MNKQVFVSKDARKVVSGVLALAVCLVICCVFAGCATATANEGTIKAPGRTYENSDKYSITSNISLDTTTIKTIDINWGGRDVVILPTNDYDVAFNESFAQALVDKPAQMHYWVDGTTLHIETAESGYSGVLIDKYLQVMVPLGMGVEEISIETTKAQGEGTVYLKNIPTLKHASVTTNGSNVTLQLPSNGNFSVAAETGAGTIDNQLAGNSLTAGKGTEAISISTNGGNLTIKEAEIPYENVY